MGDGTVVSGEQYLGAIRLSLMLVQLTEFSLKAGKQYHGDIVGQLTLIRDNLEEAVDLMETTIKIGKEIEAK